MALLQISEPGQSPEPHERKIAVGIDLGTTNSLVASVENAEAFAIPITLVSDGSELSESGAESIMLPSAVRYTQSDSTQSDSTQSDSTQSDSGVDIQVGAAVKQNAARDAANSILSVKRFIGRSYQDVLDQKVDTPYHLTSDEEGALRLRAGGQLVSPVEVSAEILKTLIHQATISLNGDVAGAVITVPAYFDDGQRQATKEAAKLAGINVLRLLNEPTAAAIAYGLDQGLEASEAGRTIAVYDLGGGTFDISILRYHRGVFEVLSTGGDAALGGDDFDRLVADWVIQESGHTPSDGAELRGLLDIACEAKEQISAQDNSQLTWQGWEGELSADQLSSLLTPLIKKTVQSCRRALRDAELERDDIDAVVMVGGSTRVPAVRDQISEYFQQPVLTDIDPDQVVVLGAARQADVLIGNATDTDMLLLDVIPLSLGIETMGGLVEKIIHRNTTIPVSKAQEFTTYKDSQTAMIIKVVQGERELVADNRPLAEFILRGIPPMVAGAAKIQVTFQVDADGLLNVSAQELSTGAMADIQVKPSFGLGDAEVTRMLRESYEHAEDDIQQRSLREHQVDAVRLADALDAAIAEDGDALLDAEERAVLESAVQQLRQTLNSGDVKSIQRDVENVSALSEAFAARRMNASIGKALSGQNIDELES